MTRRLRDSLRVVIPSRKRSHIIGDNGLRLFPYATVSVAESELDEYAKVVPAEQLTGRPDSVIGLGSIRQWILDNFDDEAIVFVDDDTSALVHLVAIVCTEIASVQSVAAVIENATNCAAEAGTSAFGFNQSPNVIFFSPLQPFVLNGWVASVWGVIGRRIRFDPRVYQGVDTDFSLQALLTDRFVWRDDRFCFVVNRWSLGGGNTPFRTTNYDYLRRKWGKFLAVKNSKGTIHTYPRVTRRQSKVKVSA